VTALNLDLMLTVARIVFLVLLYVFVLLIFRALIAEAAVGLSPRYRRRTQAPARQPAPAAPVPEPAPAPPAVVLLPERAPAEAPALAGSRLTVVETYSGRDLPVGTAFSMTAATTIGRGKHSSAVVGDPYASLDHAIIVARGGQWHLRDRGSTNGTLLNGQQVVQETRLQDGDRISIGSTVLRFSE